MTKEQKNFTDIEHKGWMKKLPSSWQPYITLLRLDRPIGIWLLLLPCFFSMALALQYSETSPYTVFITVLLFTLGAVLMRGAGCIINDLWDRELDKKVERTANRPIASGALSPKKALAFLILMLLGGLMVLLQFNLYTIVLGVISLIPIALYPLMKRITFWPQAFLGLTFNWGALLGWSALTGDIQLPAVLLYVSCVLWTIAYDTIYAYQDIEDDAKIGIKSTARLFGKNGKTAVGAFYLLCLVFLALATQSLWVFLPMLLMTRIIKKWDMNSQMSSLHAFKENRKVGWLILLAIALNGLSGY